MAHVRGEISRRVTRIVPRLTALGIMTVDTQPFRAGLTFGGRPSGPRRCVPAHCREWANLCGPRLGAGVRSEGSATHGPLTAAWLARTTCENKMQPRMAGTTNLIHRVVKARRAARQTSAQPGRAGISMMSIPSAVGAARLLPERMFGIVQSKKNLGHQQPGQR
jgi:hypothetical protein